MISDIPRPAAIPITGTSFEGPGVGAGFVIVRAKEPTGTVTAYAFMLVEPTKLAGND
jgi:hypothetical protein